MSTDVITEWKVESYPSGSLVVKPVGSFAGVHYRIGHPRGETGGVSRYDVALALADWANGAERPDTLAVLFRVDNDEVLLQNGHRIEASGPMVDVDGTLNWHTDDTADGQIARWELVEALVTNSRPRA